MTPSQAITTPAREVAVGPIGASRPRPRPPRGCRPVAVVDADELRARLDGLLARTTGRSRAGRRWRRCRAARPHVSVRKSTVSACVSVQCIIVARRVTHRWIGASSHQFGIDAVEHPAVDHAAVHVLASRGTGRVRTAITDLPGAGDGHGGRAAGRTGADDDRRRRRVPSADRAASDIDGSESATPSRRPARRGWRSHRRRRRGRPSPSSGSAGRRSPRHVVGMAEARRCAAPRPRCRTRGRGRGRRPRRWCRSGGRGRTHPASVTTRVAPIDAPMRLADGGEPGEPLAPRRRRSAISPAPPPTMRGASARSIVAASGGSSSSTSASGRVDGSSSSARSEVDRRRSTAPGTGGRAADAGLERGDERARRARSWSARDRRGARTTTHAGRDRRRRWRCSGQPSSAASRGARSRPPGEAGSTTNVESRTARGELPGPGRRRESGEGDRLRPSG